MGKKEKKLKEILVENNIIGLSESLPIYFYKEILNGELKEEIMEVYYKLGGKFEGYNYRGKFDIVGNEYIIELDEQLHFNEYRLLTLNSSLYDKIKPFPLKEYREYCINYSDKCLSAGSHGKRWTNKSCECMFGPAQNDGNLNGNGSPRWKQRAFYDFIKDVSQMVTGIPVIRLSIYDKVDYQGRQQELGEVLSNETIISKDAAIGIQELINKRL